MLCEDVVPAVPATQENGWCVQATAAEIYAVIALSVI